MAGAGALGAAMSEPAVGNGQLVYRRTDWKAEEFQELLHKTVRIKQVFEVTNLNEGKFLNNMKNSLNGFEFGFGVPSKQIQIVAALHGPPNMVNFDDTVWAKYRIGEWLNVTDPETGHPAVRNIFYPSKFSKAPEATENPSDEKSGFQDKSIQGLQRRGAKFLSCHTATEEQARILIGRLKLTEDPETIVKDMQAHILPNVTIVPAMVASLAFLQTDGRYSYITV
jgi:hypothetical protein